MQEPVLKRGTPILTGNEARKDAPTRRVGEEIGEGRLGPVRQIAPVSADDHVPLAVKVLSPPFADFITNPSFRRDLDKALAIRGKNILGYKFFSDGSKGKISLPYLVMYRANGGTLRRAVQEAGEAGKFWPLSELFALMCQLIAAMEVINGQVIHRDLTLLNVLKFDGRWVVTDYGLSTLAREATRRRIFRGSGSYLFIAPEAWDDAPDAVTMDIYSLGMIFYHLATLRLPLEVNPDTAPAWEEAHHRQPVKPPHLFNPEIPPPLSQTILRMVEKDPRCRPQDWPAVWTLLASGAADSPMNQLIRRARDERYQWESPEDVVERERRERIEASKHAQQTALEALQKTPEYQARLAEAEARKRLEEEREKKAWRDEAAPFLSQIKETIIRPLREWTDEQNRWQPSGKITLDTQEKDDGLVCAMSFPDGTTRKVEFNVLLEKDFQFRYRYDDPRDTSTATEFPTIRDQPIRAFGAATMGDGRGFNLVLAPDIWFVQVNRASLSARANARPEPFALSLAERLAASGPACRSDVREYDVSHLRMFFNGILPI